jgi:hypothetical protein
VSRLVEEIKKLQQETKSDFLTLEAGQTAVIKLALKKDGSINGDIFETFLNTNPKIRYLRLSSSQ